MRVGVAGTDVSDPAVRDLVARAQGLIAQLTGGDAGIATSLQRVYDEQPVEQAGRGIASAETGEYMRRAMASEVGEHPIGS